MIGREPKNSLPSSNESNYMTWHVRDIITSRYLGIVSAHSWLEAYDKSQSAWPDSIGFQIFRA